MHECVAFDAGEGGRFRRRRGGFARCRCPRPIKAPRYLASRVLRCVSPKSDDELCESTGQASAGRCRDSPARGRMRQGRPGRHGVHRAAQRDRITAAAGCSTRQSACRHTPATRAWARARPDHGRPAAQGGAGLAHAGQCCEEVAAPGAGVGEVDRVAVPVALERGEHEFALVDPAAVPHGDAGAGAGGDGLHGQLREADLDQFVPGCVQQRRGFGPSTSAPMTAARSTWNGSPPRCSPSPSTWCATTCSWTSNP